MDQLEPTCVACHRPVPRSPGSGYHCCMRCEGPLHMHCATWDNPWFFDLCPSCNDVIAKLKHNPMRRVGRVRRGRRGVLRTIVWDER